MIPIACCDTVNRGVAYAERQDLPESAGHQHRGARRRDRQGAVEGQAGRLQAGPDDHLRADGDQGQGDLRHLRRRVRRARLRHRERRQHRQAGLADVQHRTRSRSRLPGFGRDLEGRGVEARRRHDVGLVQLRPRARTSSTTAPATPARGIPISGPATTSIR